MPSHSTTSPTLHPYARISDPDQRKGGGLIRQTSEETQAAIKEFGRLFGFKPSRDILVDDGVSAWKGLNATPDHQLGKFIDRAKRGLVPAGDCVLIENYDRLSRQNPWAAISLVNDLRELKIHVGRLDRMKLLRYDSTDTGDFFECAIEFMRGHSESSLKSMRNGAAWQRKRKAAREKGRTITGRLPAWIREVDGRRELIPERAATIQRIFQMAADGYGHALILKRFAQEGVPPIGKGKHWARSYLAQLLRDRRVLGELQPRLRNRTPDGEVIKDYYPAVISEQQWYAARAGAAQRKTHPGRRGKHINVFAGLTANALDGDSYYAFSRSDKAGVNRVLINRRAWEGQAAARSFPFVTFERAVLKCLREINPRELLEGANGYDDVTRLETEFGGIEAEIAQAKDWMEKHKFSPTIADRIAHLEERRVEVGERLADARQRAVHPLSASWGECHTLLDIIDAAPEPDDVRLRLQSILRRIIESIQLVVVARGHARLCAVQVWFASGKRHRDYLILHRPARANASARTEGACWVDSLATIAEGDDLDLRRREDAEALEEVLLEMDIGVFTTDERRLI
jgi:DNA invertase Pin-like site-specific DNA recombinase